MDTYKVIKNTDAGEYLAAIQIGHTIAMLSLTWTKNKRYAIRFEKCRRSICNDHIYRRSNRLGAGRGAGGYRDPETKQTKPILNKQQNAREDPSVLLCR